MSLLKDINQTKLSSADIIHKTAEYLQTLDYLNFAILFGSHAQNKATAMSDIDIGIHTNRDLELLEIGYITAKLESRLKCNVDLIVLNQLYKRKPKLVFEIVSKGKIICSKNEKALVEFKKNCYLYYLDTQYLRQMMDRNLRERLENGLFGVRADVRKA